MTYCVVNILTDSLIPIPHFGSKVDQTKERLPSLRLLFYYHCFMFSFLFYKGLFCVSLPLVCLLLRKTTCWERKAEAHWCKQLSSLHSRQEGSCSGEHHSIDMINGCKQKCQAAAAASSTQKTQSNKICVCSVCSVCYRCALFLAFTWRYYQEFLDAIAAEKTIGEGTV